VGIYYVGEDENALPCPGWESIKYGLHHQGRKNALCRDQAHTLEDRYNRKTCALIAVNSSGFISKNEAKK
jgi:hypothetical protein